MNDMRKFMQLIEAASAPQKQILKEARYHTQYKSATEALGRIGDEGDDEYRVAFDTSMKTVKPTLNKLEAKSYPQTWKMFIVDACIAMQYNLLASLMGTKYPKLVQLAKKKTSKNKSFSVFGHNQNISHMGDFMDKLDHYMGIEYSPIRDLNPEMVADEGFIDALERIEADYIEKQDDKYIDIDGEDEVVMNFPDGMEWVLLDRESCSIEADAMGHCGNSGSPRMGDKILSLRRRVIDKDEEKHVPSLTFIINNGILGEMKGRGNNKPSKKYHSHIIALLKDPMVERINGGGYKPENNFELNDLTPEQQKDILNTKGKYFSMSNSDMVDMAVGNNKNHSQEDRRWAMDKVESILNGHLEGTPFYVEKVNGSIVLAAETSEVIDNYIDWSEASVDDDVESEYIDDEGNYTDILEEYIPRELLEPLTKATIGDPDNADAIRDVLELDEDDDVSEQDPTARSLMSILYYLRSSDGIGGEINGLVRQLIGRCISNYQLAYCIDQIGISDDGYDYDYYNVDFSDDRKKAYVVFSKDMFESIMGGEVAFSASANDFYVSDHSNYKDDKDYDEFVAGLHEILGLDTTLSSPRKVAELDPDKLTPEHKKVLIQDVDVAMEYARNKIKGRLEELEAVLVDDIVKQFKYFNMLREVGVSEAELKESVLKLPEKSLYGNLYFGGEEVDAGVFVDLSQRRYRDGINAFSRNQTQDTVFTEYLDSHPEILLTPAAINGKLSKMSWVAGRIGEYKNKTVATNANMSSIDGIIAHSKTELHGDRWVEAEKYIVEAHDVLKYALEIIKGPWPEKEKYILESGDVAMKYCTELRKAPWPEAESLFAEQFTTAYEYANRILKGPFPAGEPAIAAHEKASLFYAKYVLKGPFPAGEDKIATRTETATEYAELIDARFEKGEPSIALGEGAMEYYRKYIKNGRWTEAEPQLAMNRKAAVTYAKEVIQDRWKEAEYNIRIWPESITEYAKEVIQGRWPEAEARIIDYPRHALAYAKEVIQGRWPEFEKTFNYRDDTVVRYALEAVKGRIPDLEDDMLNANQNMYRFYVDSLQKAGLWD